MMIVKMTQNLPACISNLHRVLSASSATVLIVWGSQACQKVEELYWTMIVLMLMVTMMITMTMMGDDDDSDNAENKW